MIKHSWCILCATLLVAGCSQSGDDVAQEYTAPLDRSDLHAPASLPIGEECGLPSSASAGDECGSPGLLDADAVSEAINIDETQTASLPPAFVPPLTISAISGSQSVAAAGEAAETGGDNTDSELDSAPSETDTPAADPDFPAILPTFTGSTESDADDAASAAGFTPLIASDSSLSGWEIVDGKLDTWQIENGVLRCIGSGGGWLQTTNAYSDFVLRGEYRLLAGGNTGIAVRFPGEGNPSLSGIEIQLLDETAEKYAEVLDIQRTGSLYYLAAAPAPVIPHPAGEWNDIEIVCQGRQIQVSINGVKVNDVVMNSLDSSAAGQRLSTRAPVGHIALQSHESVVEFRSLAVHDLTHETPSGLRIIDIVAGEGETAGTGMNVTVHYVGQLLSGAIFDDSYRRGEAVTVPIDRVIPGWREGIEGMKVGGRRRLIVPPQLAYGEAGVGDVIPPDATLVFEVELLAVAPIESAPDAGTEAAAAVESESSAAANVGDSNANAVALPEGESTPATTEVSTQLSSPPTMEASQSRHMDDPLDVPNLFEGQTPAEVESELNEPLSLPNEPQASTAPNLQPAGQPQLLPTGASSQPIAPASSTQVDGNRPLSGPALGPRP